VLESRVRVAFEEIGQMSDSKGEAQGPQTLTGKSGFHIGWATLALCLTVGAAAGYYTIRFLMAVRASDAEGSGMWLALKWISAMIVERQDGVVHAHGLFYIMFWTFWFAAAVLARKAVWMLVWVRRGLYHERETVFHMALAHGGCDEAREALRDLSSCDAAELRSSYSLARFAIYLVPVLGFVGTLLGIGAALGDLSVGLKTIVEIKDQTARMQELGTALQKTTGGLYLAFNSTLTGLLMSAVLSFFSAVVQGSEEGAVIAADRRFVEELAKYPSLTVQTLRELLGCVAGPSAGGKAAPQVGLAGIAAALHRVEEGKLADIHRQIEALGREVGGASGEKASPGLAGLDRRLAAIEQTVRGLGESRGLMEVLRSIQLEVRGARPSGDGRTRSPGLAGLEGRLAKIEAGLLGSGDQAQRRGRAGGGIPGMVSLLLDIAREIRGERKTSQRPVGLVGLADRLGPAFNSAEILRSMGDIKQLMVDNLGVAEDVFAADNLERALDELKDVIAAPAQVNTRIQVQKACAALERALDRCDLDDARLTRYHGGVRQLADSITPEALGEELERQLDPERRHEPSRLWSAWDLEDELRELVHEVRAVGINRLKPTSSLNQLLFAILSSVHGHMPGQVPSELASPASMRAGDDSETSEAPAAAEEDAEGDEPVPPPVES